MRWPPVLVIALAGCHSVLGIGDFHTATDSGAGEVDAMADAELDAPSDSLSCLGALKSICFTTPPTGTVTVAGAVNTATDPRCLSYPQAGGPDLCVMAGSTITAATATVTGGRPLVLVATGTISVVGAVSVSSRLATGPGAGGNGPSCSGTPGGAANSGGGGGGGGGLGGSGGGGGLGANGATAGQGGAPIAIVQIRGGCAGLKGGDGELNTGGASGPGGGALALLAGTAINVSSAGGLYASGGGGGGGSPGGQQNRGAGGGGGSGGLIVLDAASIDVQGTVAANGGGGGGGADAGQGSPGTDGQEANYNQVAAGGPNEGASHGGRGGDGGAASIAARSGVQAPQGGGGGGGGSVGVIWVHGAITGGAKVSPALQLH